MNSGKVFYTLAICDEKSLLAGDRAILVIVKELCELFLD